MKRTTLFFTAPREVELREESLPALGVDEVLVETACSAVSAGTEMLVYRGDFPQLKDAHDSLSSDLKYPLSYGYTCVGRVVEVGKLADRKLMNRLVFAFQPHTSHFITIPNSILSIPESLFIESACFLANMETAVNLVQDGAPILGERVLVLGQGVVGLLTTSLLREFPLATLATVDGFPQRREASLAQNATISLDPNLPDFHSRLSGYAREGFDLTYELSGNPLALNDAIRFTRFSGRIVVGSWYGEKRAPIDLGGAFHRSRIRLISSQVSTIAPELSARWDKSRRFSVAWEALKRIQPEKWVTHRFPLSEAAEVYRLLDERPQETIQVLITYP
jgi:2-desacetyl-2-hydroxyethyl bacteriochlorophyllide A dehydrogenase